MRDPRDRDVILFLGADGVAEGRDQPWMRDATDTESAARPLGKCGRWRSARSAAFQFVLARSPSTRQWEGGGSAGAS